MNNNSLKYIIINWTPYCRRSTSLSNYFGAISLYIHNFQFKNKKYAVIKYPIQFLRTLFILIKLKPEVVIAVAPPVFCPGAAYIYCFLFSKKLIIDAHTGAVIDLKFYEIPLSKFLVRKSNLIIVTNEPLENIIRSWGGAPFVLEDPPINRNLKKKKQSQDGLELLVVNTFSTDEPIMEILKATKKTPNIKYYITGKKKNAPLDVLKFAPSNVLFTDFIPDDEYWSLLDSCDAVICLTTRRHTLVCGGYEALYSDKPLITSNFPVLKNYFCYGTIHVENTAEALVNAVEKIEKEKGILIAAIQKGKQIIEENWHHRFDKLNTILST